MHIPLISISLRYIIQYYEQLFLYMLHNFSFGDIHKNIFNIIVLQGFEIDFNYSYIYNRNNLCSSFIYKLKYLKTACKRIIKR